VSTRTILENAERVEVLSLGDRAPEGPGAAPAPSTFHGWNEKSRVPLAPADQHKLLYAIYTGIAANDDRLAACFHPRAGLHVVRGKDTVDLLFSYDCMLVHAFENGRLFTALTTSEASGPVGKILRRAGVSLDGK
jgi:hypothetical protein